MSKKKENKPRIVFWTIIAVGLLYMNKKEDYEFFLKHYPNSEYAIPAKLRIQQMKKEQDS